MALLTACSSSPSPGDIVMVNGREMIYIPGGTFVMGDDATGTFTVTLKPYLIGKCEITNAEYRQFAKLFGLAFPVPYAYDQLPVVNLDWETCDAFAVWAGGRLPTEAEWEFAARSDDGREFPWGNEWDAHLANGNDDIPPPAVPDGSKDGFTHLAPVGLYPSGASPFGVMDMAGNVWEWVADWHGEYPDEAVTDYKGPASGVRKVLRGGSYRTNRLNLRTFHRAYLPPTGRKPDVGFRIACDYPPPEIGEIPASLRSSAADTSQRQ